MTFSKTLLYGEVQEEIGKGDKCSRCECACNKENENSNAKQKQPSKRPLSAATGEATRKSARKLESNSNSIFISPKKNDRHGPIQIARALLEGENITAQDAQRLAKAYLCLVDPQELSIFDDEYELEKETDEYVAGLKPSDGMSLSTLGDSAIFFSTPSTTIRKICDVNTRVTCESMKETSTENFNGMICLLFNWMEQLVSVIYPANHL
ncbi:predicted protein [Chaetoceros tenuissimus]|uniref:Uncharacterized protein n=1 Tax=Chaetoceros tenuissimus TaxID=426638 RepID=A0AAD3CT95_9STRA|nr:predicted protein [Chaetoceros tenuissimus]